MFTKSRPPPSTPPLLRLFRCVTGRRGSTEAASYDVKAKSVITADTPFDYLKQIRDSTSHSRAYEFPIGGRDCGSDC